MLAGLGGLALVIAAAISQLAPGQTVQAQGSRQMPIFQVDPNFFQPLPNGWVTGQGSAVAVDRRDNVWIFHRPRYVPAGQKPAPPVIQYDPNGKFVQAWGGEGTGYEWFDQEHGIYVDDKDFVWLTGSARPALAGPGDRVLRSDNMLLKFTSQGKFVLQIGKRDTSEGNKDTRNVYSATDLSVYPKTNEVFVADGYINRRVIVFDADTGAFKRMWGAFGNPPVDPPNMLVNARTPPRARGAEPPAGGGARGGAGAQAAEGRGRGAEAPAPKEDPNGPPQFVGPVHSAKVSNDGLVYVADRGGNRLQVFTIDGKFVKQTRIASPSGFGISSDPQQQFLYIAQFGESHVAVLDRQSLDLLYQFGMRSPAPGDFQGPHELSVDSKGNLYVGEVNPGNRWQKFVLKGLSATRPPNALTAAQLAAPRQ
jgi:DNA-binding beta-propeller fold protein YncE